MYYKVTVYDANHKVVEMHFFESHFLARVEKHKLEARYSDCDIEIEEVFD